MKNRSAVAVSLVVACLWAASGCVGDDPGDAPPPSGGPDASTTPEGGGGGTDSATNDSAPPADAGGDATPPACTKLLVTTLAGTAAASSANGAGSVATFNAPEGITVDPTNGTLYVADTGSKLLRKVLADGTTSTYSTTAGASGTWINPRRIVFSYSVFVTDTNHDQVYSIVDIDDAMTHCGWANMRAVAVQPTAFGIYLTNGYQIAKCNSGNFTPVVFSGSDPSGFADGTGTNAKYDTTVDLAFDGDGILYVADQGNHRIRKVTVSSVADNGNVVTLAGSAAQGHVDGTGSGAQFDGPNAIFVDSKDADPAKHRLYVGDGPTIRVVTPAGEVSTLVGSNAAFVDGDGCTAKFVNIKGITKFANELYVTDVNRIRKIVMN